MKKIFVTHVIPEIGLKMLRDKGYEVAVSDAVNLEQKHLIKALKKDKYDAVLSLLTDKIDASVFDASPTAKIFANYAVGFNNFDVAEAKKRGIALTNTPGGGTERVAEHVWALILAMSCRIVEGDSYIRSNKYKGWDPMLLHGVKLAGMTLGIIGSGAIGGDVARKGKGFGMNIIYFDVKRNEKIEAETGATFYPSVDDVVKAADVVSIHVPLLDSTHHLIDARRLSMMKPSAYLVNTSRGPVVDEVALVEALKKGIASGGKEGIRGAGLDVFEFEPKLAKGLAKLPNVVFTPHIASASDESRADMAIKAATNIIEFLETGTPRNPVLVI
ncbi:MAG: hypothetical protein JWO73_288 [Candidatus Taylorbacteria bacterium]|nr:hypothetical protein [Candidatus Taylorbacteria bacterium]